MQPRLLEELVWCGVVAYETRPPPLTTTSTFVFLRYRALRNGDMPSSCESKRDADVGAGIGGINPRETRVHWKTDCRRLTRGLGTQLFAGE